MTTSPPAKAGLFDVDSFMATPTTLETHNNATDQRFRDRQALISEGRRVPTARELLRGSIFFTGNIDADMKRVASLLLRRYGRLSIMHQAYDQLFRLLGKMVDRPPRDYLGPLYGAMKHLTAVTEAISAKRSDGSVGWPNSLTACRTYGFFQIRRCSVPEPDIQSVEADAVTLQPFANFEVSLITVMAQIERVYSAFCLIGTPGRPSVWAIPVS
jgi:hypothetical protein